MGLDANDAGMVELNDENLLAPVPSNTVQNERDNSDANEENSESEPLWNKPDCVYDMIQIMRYPVSNGASNDLLNFFSHAQDAISQPFTEKLHQTSIKDFFNAN